MEQISRCPKCEVERPQTDYPKDSTKCKSGYKPYCKQCQKERYREKVSKNPIVKVKSHKRITNFILELNKSDEYIHHIFTKGGCYKFHILLSKMFKKCTPYISKDENHVITRINGRYYDITGEVTDLDGYTFLGKRRIPIVENWSFRKNNLLLLDECPNCEEPLIYPEGRETSSPDRT
jgi:hypothetical protein